MRPSRPSSAVPSRLARGQSQQRDAGVTTDMHPAHQYTARKEPKRGESPIHHRPHSSCLRYPQTARRPRPGGALARAIVTTYGRAQAHTPWSSAISAGRLDAGLLRAASHALRPLDCRWSSGRYYCCLFTNRCPVPVRVAEQQGIAHCQDAVGGAGSNCARRLKRSFFFFSPPFSLHCDACGAYSA